MYGCRMNDAREPQECNKGEDIVRKRVRLGSLFPSEKILAAAHNFDSKGRCRQDCDKGSK